ncbi:hypothetical protein SO802_026634 [Lithocarpus litseifolius]|uniref:Uncharacterized protein n=1 Tax=Lithocarpus litseifolius TaxID=425828 RepID=A0AAW2C3F1_9ROSI
MKAAEFFFFFFFLLLLLPHFFPLHLSLPQPFSPSAVLHFFPRQSEPLPSADPSANRPGDPQPQRSSGPTNNSTSAPSKPSDQPSVRHRGPSSSVSASASYTEEQIAIVRQIKKKKDYYEILGVEKSCTVEDAADFDAEEIFRSFFGGMAPTAAT